MADWSTFFGEYGAVNNGGGARALDVFEHRSLPWALVPEMTWKVEVTYKDLTGPAVTAQLRNLAFTASQNTDGILRLTFSGDALEEDVVVNVPVADADNAAAISAAVETDIGNEGDLAGVLDSVVDNGGDVDVGFTSYVNIEVEWIPTWEQWFVEAAGDYAAGSYVVMFEHENIGSGVSTVPTPGNVDLATTVADVETNIEDTQALFGVVASANDNGVAGVTIITESGITGLTVEATGPAEAQWGAVDQTGSVAVAQTEIVSVALNTLSKRGRFPRGVDRHEPAVQVLEGFGAASGRTVTIGDEGAEDAVLTVLGIESELRWFGDATATEALARYESAWEPLATFDIGNPATLTQGRLVIEIGWSPTP